MRKKTIKHLFDNIFWYVVYMLPLIFVIISWFKGAPVSGWESMFLSPGSGFGLADSPVITALFYIFGQGGICPLFADYGVICFLTYFVHCWILHLAIDVLLFIVRWAHSMLDGFLGGKCD